MKSVISKNQRRQARRYDRVKYRKMLETLATDDPLGFLEEAAASLLTPCRCHSIGNILTEVKDDDTRQRGEALLAQVVNKMNGRDKRRRTR